MKSAILTDLDRCIGCHTCVVACRQWHQDLEHECMKINLIGPGTIDGQLRMDFYPQMTERCDLATCEPEPPCVALCPVQALILCDSREMLSPLLSSKRYQISKIS